MPRRIKPFEIDAIVLAEANSTTGRYKVFLAEHIVDAQSCYDVGCFHLRNGQMIRKHYRNREEALARWEELKTQLTESGNVIADIG